MKKQKGFSIIELLIVLLILAIIAVIAIPNLVAARISANEGAAISTLRTYHSAQTTYQTTIGAGNYAGTPYTTNAFTVLANNHLLDSALGTGIKNGYIYSGHSQTAVGTTPACHLGQAYPTRSTGISATGKRHYVIATEGVIHWAAATGAAGWGPGVCQIATGWNPLSN